jgi:hypothetical protein
MPKTLSSRFHSTRTGPKPGPKARIGLYICFAGAVEKHDLAYRFLPFRHMAENLHDVGISSL